MNIIDPPWNQRCFDCLPRDEWPANNLRAILIPWWQYQACLFDV
jgi:hypothetical protein